MTARTRGRSATASSADSLEPAFAGEAEAPAVVDGGAQARHAPLRRIWLAPHALPTPTAAPFSSAILTLPHPATGLAASWLWRAEEEAAPLQALLHLPSGGVRSWFVGDSVVSGGSGPPSSLVLHLLLIYKEMMEA
jgi:hypothetical protein